ncbi:Sodium/calcium exchanger membrane region [Acididesulfobacillus acetoxydans]|uniref:Sodium/calcium exchanger membrane region n=1 Tax=Acididesulfobacillus acetoxydans TaxID=1561005 RepID=A0A8S0Y297_9FIRM|nr:sodium:calcium antiporter [Acididesulfobacillus acetoxydans]CAA7600515.1 Sodium/calcium exchanger membrane region [Acididesulfobacillus acetoxydans]CEJ06649.1 Sodium/calcium exchanger membrane region [Acididesulfobacillus acetoxydans]
MVSIFAVLLAAALLIYFSCELFVNGIEWTGVRFNIAKNAVGTVLAAVGTALPESVVTFIAVVFGRNLHQKDIGVGAALGGPLVLSTIAYAVVGLSLLGFSRRRARGRDLDLRGSKLGRDQAWFLSIFIFKVALGFFAFTGKALTGFLFLAAYAFYFYAEMKPVGESGKGETMEPLRFRPHSSRPETGWIVFQTLLSLLLIAAGSQIFVHSLESLSARIGLPSHVVALFLSPVATELPEILNAVIWVRQGKERLALANISGAMMIQATVPSALGILFTPWLFDKYLAMAGLFTILSILFLWFTLRRRKLSAYRLAWAAVFYLLFTIVVFQNV